MASHAMGCAALGPDGRDCDCAVSRRQYTREGNPSLMMELKCGACNHTIASHGGPNGCGALDAAGDTCACPAFFGDAPLFIRHEAPSHVSDALRAMDKLDPVCDDVGFTVEDYAAHRKITISAADSRLRRLHAQGKIIMGWKRSEDGRRVRVFQPKEN